MVLSLGKLFSDCSYDYDFKVTSGCINEYFIEIETCMISMLFIYYQLVVFSAELRLVEQHASRNSR